MKYLTVPRWRLITLPCAGSGLQLPGSSFLNVLARLVEAAACLENNADADVDDKLPNDIVSLSYKILQAILQHASEPGASISVKLAPKDTERMLVSMIKVRLHLPQSLASAPHPGLYAVWTVAHACVGT